MGLLKNIRRFQTQKKHKNLTYVMKSQLRSSQGAQIKTSLHIDLQGRYKSIEFLTKALSSKLSELPHDRNLEVNYLHNQFIYSLCWF